MNRSSSLLIVAAFLIACVTSQGTTTYYIDAVNGNDNNQGTTAAQAFKTLASAITKTSSQTFTLLNFNLAAGTYPVSGNLPTASSSNIVFTAAANNTAIITAPSGTFQFTGASSASGVLNVTFVGIAFQNIALPTSGFGGINIVTVEATFQGCRFNTAAGIYVPLGVTVDRCTFNGFAGQAVSTGSSSALIINSNFYNGVKVLDTNASSTIQNCQFVNITNAIYLPPGSITAGTFNFIGINATNVVTAFGITVNGPGATSVTVKNSVFSNAVTGSTYMAFNQGGSSGSLSVTFNNVNITSISSRAILVQGRSLSSSTASFTSLSVQSSGSQDLAAVDIQRTTATFTSVLFSNDTTSLNADTNFNYTLTSGAIRVRDSKATFNNVAFTNNFAAYPDTDGGALVCQDSILAFTGTAAFSGNGYPDLICDGGCNSTGIITNPCTPCARSANGSCIVVSTSGSVAPPPTVTTGRIVSLTTGVVVAPVTSTSSTSTTEASTSTGNAPASDSASVRPVALYYLCAVAAVLFTSIML